MHKYWGLKLLSRTMIVSYLWLVMLHIVLFHVISPQNYCTTLDLLRLGLDEGYAEFITDGGPPYTDTFVLHKSPHSQTQNPKTADRGRPQWGGHQNEQVILPAIRIFPYVFLLMFPLA